MSGVVITSHGDPATCYLTAMAVRSQMPEAEIIVVADGGTEYKWEKQPGFRCIRGSFGSPQASRDVGVRESSGDHVLVLESHVIVSDPGMLLASHRSLGAAITFPIRVAEGPDMFDVFGHETDWGGNLWYKRLDYSRPKNRGLRMVSQFGHSCFALDRKWYLESGGYTGLFNGWGGEEPFLCLKAWMLGRECWQDPVVWHAHHLSFGPGVYRPDLSQNLKILGYLIAGRQTDPLMLTPEMREERQRICGGPFSGDIDKLRKHLKSLGVE